jgi:hypothetical protein
MSTIDLRQKRLFEPFNHLTPEDREDLGHLAGKINTLRRVEEALATGYVKTPTLIPEFYGDKNYIEALQWLSFYSIRGYMSEHRKPASLSDIYYRVVEKIKAAQREGTWPQEWKVPSKRTIDRRVNEIASNNPLENHIMAGNRPRVICTSAGFYCPNPALYEDVAKILEGSA